VAATLTESTLVPLYECLRTPDAADRLNLVLVTPGGSVTVARRIALLLRDHADRLTIWVPYFARSAGTLLCLAADDLMLGPMAELGPIDGHLGRDGPRPDGLPSRVSSEDVRAFVDMARDWFGIRRDEDALPVLALVTQRVFPLTLTQFYRTDRYIRTAAEELLTLSAPDRDAATRNRILDALVVGRGDHDDRIGRSEAEAMGLPVRRPTPTQEARLWDIWRSCDAACGDRVSGIIAGPGYLAREVADWTADGEHQQLRVRWESQA
jgi:hypothetical protein